MTLRANQSNLKPNWKDLIDERRHDPAVHFLRVGSRDFDLAPQIKHAFPSNQESLSAVLANEFSTLR